MRDQAKEKNVEHALSMIVDPLSQVVAEGSDEEELVSARIDPELVDTVRQDFPALKDRVLS
jgi:predicted amidohydrolase